MSSCHSNQYRAPGEPATNALEQHMLTVSDATIAHGEIERKRHRRSRCVGMLINRDHHLGGVQPHATGGGLKDSDIGLVRD